MENKVLLVYPGLGKTYCAKIMDNILEIQLSQFKNVNVRNFCEHFPEHLKGNFEIPMQLDENFPKNVIDAINKGFEENKIVVMALKNSNIDFLVENNFDFAFVVPAKEKIEELKNQYFARGNTQEYIERNISNLGKVFAQIENMNKTIYYIEKGCHLAELVQQLSDKSLENE